VREKSPAFRYFRRSVAVASLLGLFSAGLFSATLTLAIYPGLVRGDVTGKGSTETGEEQTKSSLFDELKTFADVLSIVQQDYVKPIDNRKVVEGAIKGMLTTLDPHSGYLDPEFYRDLQVQTKGEFGGLGVEINVRDGQLVVVSPMEGSPAAAAGVRPGDVIVKIDGKFAKDMALVEAVKKLRGTKGSAVVLSISRKPGGALIDISVVRDTIQVRSIKSRYLGEGLGYVRVSQFAEHTAKDLKSALKGLQAEASRDGASGIRGLVLDVRNNPGGLLNQAVEISDLFLKDGVIVYTDGRDPAQRHNFYAHSRGTEPDYPIAVLVNGGSASAAEIVSGALQDAARAIIVGTQTFGKGSVQTIMPLANGGAVTLTTALYYTKSGRSIQVTGVKPDVMVEAPEVVQTKNSSSSPDRAGGDGTGRKVGEPLYREGDLPGAIENPQEGEAPAAAQGSDPAAPLKKINQISEEAVKPIDIERIEINDWLSQDPQFSKALEIVKRDAV
jgi:carboxyl-terminal processing protease